MGESDDDQLEISAAMEVNEHKLNSLIGFQENEKSSSEKKEIKFNSPRDTEQKDNNSVSFGPITKLFTTFENTMTKLRKNTDVLIDQKITQDKELNKHKDTIT